MIGNAPAFLTATLPPTITPTGILLHPVARLPLVICAGALDTRLSTGIAVRFISYNGAELYLHTEPGFKTDAPWVAPVGSTLQVVQGPMCVDQAFWWLLEYNGSKGWVSETMIDGRVLIEPWQ